MIAFSISPVLIVMWVCAVWIYFLLFSSWFLHFYLLLLLLTSVWVRVPLQWDTEPVYHQTRKNWKDYGTKHNYQQRTNKTTRGTNKKEANCGCSEKKSFMYPDIVWVFQASLGFLGVIGVPKLQKFAICNLWYALPFSKVKLAWLVTFFSEDSSLRFLLQVKM